jgi:hypothetical protein
MSAITGEISDFLRESGFDCVEELRGGVPVLWVEMPAEAQGQKLPGRCVVPWPVLAGSPEEAQEQAQQMAELLKDIAKQGHKPIIITEDRWRRQPEMMRARLLAHLEVFTPMFARNCEVRKIDKETAAAFLNENHSYGDAACKYRYGLYLKRYTGKRGEISPLASLGRNDSEELGRNESESAVEVYSGSGYVTPGTLVAVATFSNARKWQKGEKVIRSYEWTRYASLPGVRINGGMGKMLKAFVKEVQPDDIMSYADLEWSEGAVYEQLCFRLEGQKDPVAFEVDGSWRRSPVGPGMTRKAGPGMTRKVGLGMTGVDMPPPARGCRSEAETGVNGSHSLPTSLYLQNFGSNKYRLKLTEYE